MNKIIIEEDFYRELKANIDTNLIFADIEILEYYQQGDFEFLKIELPFTTTGNILTYQYTPKTDELSLIDSTIYAINLDSKEAAYIDRNTIMKLYAYCRQKEAVSREITIKIDDQKMEQLYSMIINEIPLTNASLFQNGFTEEEITSLLISETIKLTKTNEYILTSVEKFYQYGIKLLLTGYIKTANICFAKCHELDPTDRDSCLQIFYGYLRLNEYDFALEMLSYIETLNPEQYQMDNNLYLYLLGKLTDLNESYQKRIHRIKESSVLIPENTSYPNPEKENELRRAILKNKYKYALNLLNDLLATEDKYIVSKSLLKELLLQTINTEEKFKSRILFFAKTKKYALIIMFLDNKMKKRKLYQTEKSIYAIANEILEIIKTRTIMPPISIGNNTVSEAVKNRSFEEARQLNIQFLKEHNIPIQNDITDILLTDLNNLISKLTEENTFETSILISTGPESTLDYESIIKSAEEIAYYLNAERISIDRAKSIYHLTEEQVLLIKLIYARDYYTEGLYQKGDKLLSEVENSSNQTSVVTTLLDEVKTNRASYKELISPYTKKRVNLTDK